VDSTIKTYTGRKVDLAKPDPGAVCIEDVAHALSMVCRYNGHCRSFYSVAEHSVNVEALAGEPCSQGVRLALLMHDAGEAFVGDVVAPLKILLPEYRTIEEGWERAVSERYEISRDAGTLQVVKRADIEMREVEKCALFPSVIDPHDKSPGFRAFLLDLVRCLSPAEAELRFLARFHQLRSR
jgi:hypothetical protein